MLTMLAERPAVIAEHDDDRVVFQAALTERGEHVADVAVREGDCRVVRAAQLPRLAVGHPVRLLRLPPELQHLDVVVVTHLRVGRPGDARHALGRIRVGGQRGLLDRRVEVKEPLGEDEWQVRLAEAHRDEEGALVRPSEALGRDALQDSDRILARLHVLERLVVVVGDGEPSVPVPADRLLRREVRLSPGIVRVIGPAARLARPRLLRNRPRRLPAVKDLPHAHRHVALLLEVLRDGRKVARHVAPV